MKFLQKLSQYRFIETPQPADVKRVIGRCIASLKRKKAPKDQATGQRTQVGKDSLKIEVYEYIIIDQLREAVRKDSEIVNPKRRGRRPYFRQLLKKALDISNTEYPFPIDMHKFSSKNFIAYLTTCKTSF